MASVFEIVLKKLLELSETKDFIVPKHHIRQLLHPGLRIVHLRTKLRYTVAGVDGERGVVTLETPDNRTFEVGMNKFEQDYAVD